MKVKNMTSSRGNKVANQFIVSGAVIQLPQSNEDIEAGIGYGPESDTYTGELFQSYDSNIALKAYECGNTGNIYRVFIDEKYWNYSATTSKYRNQFLGESTKETQAKIDSGEYQLTNLN